MTTIGILLDHRVYRKLQIRTMGTERVKLYNKAAHRLGLKLLYMSLRGIQLRSGKTLGLLRYGNQYVKRTQAIPKVIHNRTFPQGEAERRHLRSLSGRSYVFNAQNRYSKYRIHRLLSSDPWLRRHLPHSLTYSRENLRRMMSIHDTIYIKPQRGSVGRGIIRIRRVNGGQWSIRTTTGVQTLSRIAMLRKVQLYVGHRLYMIQKGIQLATYQGRPYDIRVSVQRVHGGKWQVTGMVGKVARSGSHVTNVARGGAVKRCEPLFRHGRLPVQATRAKVVRASLLLANYLGRRLYRLADIGFDIGLSKTGKVYFIEMNCRDQRYSFAKAGMRDVFYRTYENPLRFAAYLARR
ncbi:MAG: YheC/YheD family protein [Paenibacillaceae bacterium]